MLSGAFGYLTDYLLWLAIYVSLLVHTWCFFRFFPRDKHRKSGLLIGNGLVAVCMLGMIALAAESYLRFAAVHTDAFGMSLPARRWFALHTDLNSLGCRDAEWGAGQSRRRAPCGVRGRLIHLRLGHRAGGGSIFGSNSGDV